ncbi:hypothetical protein, partial [Gordonia sp. (in: high G+C Gram-positive bacteria)]
SDVERESTHHAGRGKARLPCAEKLLEKAGLVGMTLAAFGRGDAAHYLIDVAAAAAPGGLAALLARCSLAHG